MTIKSGNNDGVPSIMLTFDTGGFSSSSIELAIAFAVDNRCALHGLFVEDMDLLNLANLPFSHEVSLLNARSRAFDSEQLFRDLEARSRQFRQILVQQAEQSSLPWRYSTARGRKLNMVLQESANVEYSIVGQSRVAKAQTRVSDFLPKRILLVIDQNKRLFQALALVMSKLAGQPIELLLLPSYDDLAPNFLERLTKMLKNHANSQLIQIPATSLTAILSSHTQTVVCAITSRHDLQLTRTIIEQANCPVIVVS